MTYVCYHLLFLFCNKKKLKNLDINIIANLIDKKNHFYNLVFEKKVLTYALSKLSKN